MNRKPISKSKASLFAIPKPFYQSKTLWVGVIGIVIEILQLRQVINIIDPVLLSILVSSLMIILRFVTTQPVGL